VVDADDYPLDTSEVVEDGLLPVVDLWAEASTMAVQRAGAERKAPPIDTEQRLRASIDRGYQMFAGKNAQCIQCHGREGKGDGEQSELYDDWNKRKKGVGAEQTRRLAARFALPIQRLRPRNFTQGVFRGGQRPIDLYWRIHAGIKGTPMPAAGPAPGISGALTPEKIWDVVNYVRSRAGSRR
jgi:mono/diheme cytochrome c family protein